MQKDIATKLTYLYVIEHVQIDLNIEFEILFESFEHNSSRAHIFYTNMQKDFATKYTYFLP